MRIIKREPGAPKRNVILDMSVPIEPQEYDIKTCTNRVAIFDTETDPFELNRVVEPFTCGYWLPDTDEYFDFWGDDCIAQFFAHLVKYHGEETLTFFVHNGGNFDFYFITEFFDSGHAPFIINGRLVKVIAGGHEFRDSYAMIPVALAVYDKMTMDYDKLQRWPCSIVSTRKTVMVREYYKAEILEYMKRDCTSLGELVTNYLDMFGNKMTMASVALPMLRSYHGFDTIWETLDTELRPYYFGGRNQCFATGILKGDWKIYDINSSYPDVMKRYKHPVSANPIPRNKITENTMFAHIRAHSLGALPTRNENGSLSFPIGTGDFFACIHEINAGIATGTLTIHKVYTAYEYDETTNFSDFVDTFYKMRLEASTNGDEIRKLFYKLILNSSYGKFAMDPRRYEKYLFDPNEIPSPDYCDKCHSQVTGGINPNPCDTCISEVTSPWGWHLHSMHMGRMIYSQPIRIRSNNFYNVATAASITSAARASLLYAINETERPVYCDTDSIICEGLTESEHIRFDDKELGAWKLEAVGDTACIAGKKLYAVYNDGDVVKKASKGVRLTADEIKRVCNGEVIEYANPVPKFSLGHDAQFTTRRIRRTG